MKSKFYTPKIEEFYVGFLFETYEDRFNSWKLNSIHNMYDYQTVFHLRLEKDRGGMIVDSNYIRVKYLDKEDIESLGFKDHNGESHIYEENNVIGFVAWNGKDEYTIKYDTESRVIKSIVHTAGLHKMFNCFFSIKVKNKSELKKLLIQLEIINE